MTHTSRKKNHSVVKSRRTERLGRESLGILQTTTRSHLTGQPSSKCVRFIDAFLAHKYTLSFCAEGIRAVIAER